MQTQKIATLSAVVTVRHETEEKGFSISLLINSIYFFLESVFIIKEENGFRLLVIHQNRVLVDQTYKTVKGARIAFIKMFSCKAWKEGVKPDWSFFYPPELPWMEEKKALFESQGH